LLKKATETKKRGLMWDFLIYRGGKAFQYKGHIQNFCILRGG